MPNTEAGRCSHVSNPDALAEHAVRLLLLCQPPWRGALSPDPPIRNMALLRRLKAVAGALRGGTVILGLTLVFGPTHVLPAQDSRLDELLLLARKANPGLGVTAARIDAARARVGPAGARPDPMLMLGIQNFPVTAPSLTSEDMTMKMVGVSQTFLYPGTRGLRRDVARRGVDAAIVAEQVAVGQIVRDVKTAYYELAFIDSTMQLLARQATALDAVAQFTEVRYQNGTAMQSDVLTARLEAAVLSHEASELRERRTSTLAELNALVNRPTDTALDAVTIPARVRRAAIADTGVSVQFLGSLLGSRAAGSELLPLATLQARAVDNNATLKAQRELINVQMARLRVAQNETKPEFDVSVQYGQRQLRPDMLTAQVSIPLKLQQRSVQRQEIAEAQAELAMLEAEQRAERTMLQREIAKMVSEAEHARTQLAIFAKAVLAQGRATVDAAFSGYRNGGGSLTQVLGAQSAILSYETSAVRALVDFAKAIAALEQMVGAQVLQ